MRQMRDTRFNQRYKTCWRFCDFFSHSLELKKKQKTITKKPIQDPCARPTAQCGWPCSRNRTFLASLWLFTIAQKWSNTFSIPWKQWSISTPHTPFFILCQEYSIYVFTYIHVYLLWYIYIYTRTRTPPWPTLSL